MTTEREKRIRSAARFIEGHTAHQWNPTWQKRHMRRFSVSAATANRDFDMAVDRILDRRRSASRA